MKIAIKVLLAVALLPLLASCGDSTPKEVVVEDKFKMEIPGHMTSTDQLNDVASLQYMNVFKELYVMVITDTSDEIREAMAINDLEVNEDNLFEDFRDIIGSSEEGSFLIQSDLNKLTEKTINGMRAFTFENTRDLNGIEAYYQLALVEGKNAFYQVITWTLEPRKDVHKEAMEKMIASFNEL